MNAEGKRIKCKLATALHRFGNNKIIINNPPKTITDLSIEILRFREYIHHFFYVQSNETHSTLRTMTVN